MKLVAGCEGRASPAGAEPPRTPSVRMRAGTFKSRGGATPAPPALRPSAATCLQMYKSYRPGRGDPSSSKRFSRDKRALQTQGRQ